MTLLLPEQVDALQELRSVCEVLAIEIVVIGATALRAWIPDAPRLTEDVDVAIALDLDAFGPLTTRLANLGWRPDSRWEPRWHTRGHARVDLLPVGLRARQDRQIRWPVSKCLSSRYTCWHF
jgi:predicted nucleotidyltransferase